MRLSARRASTRSPWPQLRNFQEGQAAGHAEGGNHGQGFAGGISRLVAALVFATGAEVLSFFAPDQMAWKVASMAIAALAIWLAGIDTYKKGIAALLRGKLNINALMSVAVTGAFLIGQWPEAAMVMALYAIAELHRGQGGGPGPKRYQGLAGTGARRGFGAGTEWSVVRYTGGFGGHRSDRAHQAGRTACRWTVR